ncbi:hypothetical protein AB6A40_004922 [Gnathostoma spinigerum]|uniref:receptor protein-tyrosine kinase n=1 Tax=Gnathostoma spinigerum TaxID=75299 RepID=A0ABD6EE31_9BILA
MNSFIYVVTVLICYSLFTFITAASTASTTHPESFSYYVKSLFKSRDWELQQPSFVVHDSPVFGIAVRHGLLAVAHPNALDFYRLKRSTRSHLQKIRRISVSNVIDRHLLQFDFISPSLIFMCNHFNCTLCSVDGALGCIDIPTPKDPLISGNLSMVKAVFTPNNTLFVKFIDQTRYSIIYVYTLLTSLNNGWKLTPVRHDKVLHFTRNFMLGTAFNRKGYTYFVGSAERPFEPWINAGSETTIVVSSVRITRICDSDRTKDLHSKIDMALTCGDFGLTEYVTSSAALFDEDRDKLIVVLQGKRSEGHRKTYICSYNMSEIERNMNEIWIDCQNSTGYNYACEDAREKKNLSRQCFIFTRLADVHRTKICSRYGGVRSKALDNCALDLSTSRADNYGWLEQFLPFNGTVIARMDNSLDDIHTIEYSSNREAAFLLDLAGSLIRISIHKSMRTEPILWKKQLETNMCSFGVDLPNANLYYLTENDIKMIEISCLQLYHSCASLEAAEWSDPLKCQWCPEQGGKGFSFPAEIPSECRTVNIFNTCPPFIEYISPPILQVNNTNFEIFGQRFYTLKNIEIDICGDKCAVIMESDTKLNCVTKRAPNVDANCDVILYGLIDAHGPYSISYTLEKPIGVPSVSASASDPKMRRIKTLATTVAIVILVILIILVIFIIRRCQSRQKASTKCNATFSLHGTLQKNDCRESYDRLLDSIDPRWRISLSNLQICSPEKPLGKGHFGTVYKAIYVDKAGKQREVACKLLHSNHEGVVSGVRDFLKEGQTMTAFDHPNVIRLIGISIDQGYPMIITEYMTNGDLHKYISCSLNKITLRMLLEWATNIVDGMVYLHQQDVIHRDLAARNCMLDENNHVKISDFGLSRISSQGMYQALNVNREMPIRWMPPESLISQTFTPAGDVWAYGVVLWELTTRGLVPFEGIHSDLLLRMLQEGQRLQRPMSCPLILYQKVMKPCWEEDPKKRPTFKEIAVLLRSIMYQFGKQDVGVLRKEYEKIPSQLIDTSKRYGDEVGLSEKNTVSVI